MVRHWAHEPEHQADGQALGSWLRGPCGTSLAASRILTEPALQDTAQAGFSTGSRSHLLLSWAASIGHLRQLLPAWLYLPHICTPLTSQLLFDI